MEKVASTRPSKFMLGERTPSALDADRTAELLERVRQAELEPTYSLEESRERSLRRLTELNSLNQLTKTSLK